MVGVVVGWGCFGGDLGEVWWWFKGGVRVVQGGYMVVWGGVGLVWGWCWGGVVDKIHNTASIFYEI